MKKNNKDNFRFFVYKTMFIFFCTYLLYNFTIGKKIDDYEEKIIMLKTDQGRDSIRNLIRKEISKSLNKEKIINEEDRILIKKFIKKIQKELD